jgi:hypothetical protein
MNPLSLSLSWPDLIDKGSVMDRPNQSLVFDGQYYAVYLVSAYMTDPIDDAVCSTVKAIEEK